MRQRLDGFYLCCVDGWWRLVCLADNLNHFFLPRRRFRWLCDLHDRLLHEIMENDVDEVSP